VSPWLIGEGGLADSSDGFGRLLPPAPPAGLRRLPSLLRRRIRAGGAAHGRIRRNTKRTFLQASSC